MFSEVAGLTEWKNPSSALLRSVPYGTDRRRAPSPEGLVFTHIFGWTRGLRALLLPKRAPTGLNALTRRVQPKIWVKISPRGEGVPLSRCASSGGGTGLPPPKGYWRSGRTARYGPQAGEGLLDGARQPGVRQLSSALFYRRAGLVEATSG